MTKLLILALLLVPVGLIADPLFESNEKLEVTLEAPLAQIRKERDKTQDYPGTLTYEGQRFSVSLSARGNTRLKKQNCRYPPLRLDFDKADRKDTLFHHEKHTKLAVQCHNGSEFRDFLRSEYLIYKMYNLLTDNSFRVRWLDVNYVEEKRRRSEPAFLIERKARLTKRLGLEKVEVERIRYEDLNVESNALAVLFQYIVANPDYSFVVGTDGDCCHNAKLLGTENAGYIPVPYDFDSSGLVDASYAIPAAHLGIRNVTMRLYRGHCMHNESLEPARSLIVSKRDELLGLIKNDTVLSGRAKSKYARYLDNSIDILEKDKRYEREIIEACRAAG